MGIFPAMGDIGLEKQAVTDRKQIPGSSDDAGHTSIDTIEKFTSGMVDVLRIGLMGFQGNQDGFGPQRRQAIPQVLDGPIGKPGDFLLFEANLPHLWRNPYDLPAEFILILQTPGATLDPVKRHFVDYSSVPHIG